MMPYSDSSPEGQIRELRAEIYRLRHQLADYHDRLEESLEHDRQFQLKATWGVVNALCGISGYVGSSYLLDKVFGQSGFLMQVLAGIIALVAYGAAFSWSDKGRDGDLKKLSRLPKWDSFQPD